MSHTPRPHPRRRARGPVAALVTLTLGALLAVLAAAPALAVGYRYWTFWDGKDGTWSFATQGPSVARPADGTVQGFRFAVSADDPKNAVKPRAAADFTAICGATPAVDGRKRVALVIDFGVPGDAPKGETPPHADARTACAVVTPDATTAEALAEVAKPLRYNESALLCAISGYPAKGCADPVDAPAADPSKAGAQDPAPTAAEKNDADGDSGGPAVGLWAGLAGVLVLGAAGLWQARRRRDR
ncbi:SCO2322 family protein [Streptomyces sp. BI20]|uniref:SCO2322 family protein n=1 Tax=Streptomyces sp. BI20 TaxID=3403460 RepID=UPI003C709E68